MAILDIPFRGSSARPAGRQRVKLEGVDYLIDFDWNGREGRWYVGIYDASGAPIVTGCKLVANARVARRTIDERRPPGRLLVIDRSSTDVDPGIDDLAQRVTLSYLESTDPVLAGVA
jgi:hypothetical protein